MTATVARPVAGFRPRCAAGRWVAAGPGPDVATRVEDLVRRARADQPGGLFDGAPSRVENVEEGSRRVTQTCVLRALEALRADHGCEPGTVDLLLVFAARYAALHARALVDRVDDPTARLNPRISTDMETSEPVRGALAELGSGRPRGALVLASAYDERTAARLAPVDGRVLVLRLEVWPGSDEAPQTDVLASCSVGGGDVGAREGVA